MKKILFSFASLAVLSVFLALPSDAKACDPVVGTFGFSTFGAIAPLPVTTFGFSTGFSTFGGIPIVPARRVLAVPVAPRGQFIQQRFGPRGHLRAQTIAN